MKYKRIYLNGYMAAGKSTIGARLAEKLGFSFIDIDKYIEEKYFMSIPSIFAKEGEASFRKKEKLALEELSDFENVVIATGGGTPCFFDNMEVILSTGLSIYLKTPKELLIKRLLQNNSQRPIVKGKSEDELSDFIDEAMSQRETFYLRSNIVCVSDDDLTADMLIQQLNNYSI